MPARLEAALAVVPAAGRGERLGAGRPKAWVDLAGEPLVAVTLRRLSASGGCPRIVLVSDPPEPRFRDPAWFRARGCPGLEAIVPGGETRNDSVRRGLEAVALPDEALVLVHDAARPLVSPSDVEAVLWAAAEAGAAVGGWPLADTIKRVDGDLRVLGTVDRRGLFAAATPQAFRLGVLRKAIELAGSNARFATDEASLIEGAGLPVAAVPVSRFVFKVTYPQDLADATRLLSLLEADGGEAR